MTGSGTDDSSITATQAVNLNSVVGSTVDSGGNSMVGGSEVNSTVGTGVGLVVVGRRVGRGVGGGVGNGVGRAVGAGVGRGVGSGVGEGVGSGVGEGVGRGVGEGVGASTGELTGAAVVGRRVGATVGAFVENGAGVESEVGSGVGDKAGVGTDAGGAVVEVEPVGLLPLSLPVTKYVTTTATTTARITKRRTTAPANIQVFRGLNHHGEAWAATGGPGWMLSGGAATAWPSTRCACAKISGGCGGTSWGVLVLVVGALSSSSWRSGPFGPGTCTAPGSIVAVAAAAMKAAGLPEVIASG